MACPCKRSITIVTSTYVSRSIQTCDFTATDSYLLLIGGCQAAVQLPSLFPSIPYGEGIPMYEHSLLQKGHSEVPDGFPADKQELTGYAWMLTACTKQLRGNNAEQQVNHTSGCDCNDDLFTYASIHITLVSIKTTGYKCAISILTHCKFFPTVEMSDFISAAWSDLQVTLVWELEEVLILKKKHFNHIANCSYVK